jgi:3-dehydroquinate synthase
MPSKKQLIKIGQSATAFYWDAKFSHLKKVVTPASTVIITDENVFKAHASLFKGWNLIVLKAGEQYKISATVNSVIERLIEMQVDRSFTLVGVGGGVITDITGYVASVYMRGIRFGFVPTSLLAIVDASIGGKNGVDVGVYKNLVGVIRQPDFILHDISLLKSLPEIEWKNGFAEIIKHACIKDATLFKQLQKGSIVKYQRSKKLLAELIKRNATIKLKLVQEDPFEKGNRRLLNFGHTLGHAIENQYELSHGQAISIGMTYASLFSASICGFANPTQVIDLLAQYGLPTFAKFDIAKMTKVMSMDKKREKSAIHFVLLNKIGQATIKKIELTSLAKIVKSIS